MFQLPTTSRLQGVVEIKVSILKKIILCWFMDLANFRTEIHVYFSRLFQKFYTETKQFKKYSATCNVLTVYVTCLQ